MFTVSGKRAGPAHSLFNNRHGSIRSPSRSSDVVDRRISFRTFCPSDYTSTHVGRQILRQRDKQIHIAGKLSREPRGLKLEAEPIVAEVAGRLRDAYPTHRLV